MASPERIEAFVEKQTEFAQKNQPEIDRRVADQRAREVQIIEQSQSFCPVDKLQDRTLRAEDIERALKEGYGDANVLRSLLCLNNATLSMPQLPNVAKVAKDG